MCGLGAILVRHRHAARAPREVIPERWLDGLDASVAHRGPDGSGRFRDRALPGDGWVVDVALVHRRLAIIDPAGGAQPMVLEHDGARTAVVFNGCIYNHAAVRRELQGAGHRFSTDHSDTEVLLHGWRAWGAGVFDRLDGMFGLALWDGRAGTLTLARDRFGEKPVYARGAPGGVWVVGSVAAGVARATDAPAAIEAGGVREWLVRGYGPVRTPWEGVEALPPGTTRTLGGDVERCGVFAPIPWATDQVLARSMGGSELGGLLEASVTERLDADVPVACLLSGGIDSSAVALAATRVLRARGDGRRLVSVCVRMPEARYDESPHAAAVAEAIGTEHRTVEVSASPAADLGSLVASMGLPFGDSSLLPTSWAFEALRGEGKVALTGDGGDELFLGYRRYAAAEDLSLLVFLRVLGVTPPVGVLDRRDPKGLGDSLARFLTAARWRGYRDLLDIFPTPDAARVLGGRQRWADASIDFLASAGAARRLDVQEHLPGDLLRKVDHASMVAGVEARAPLLARALADAALGRPVVRSFSHRWRKRALREYLATGLPRALADRPKSGFAVPIGAWFRGDNGGMRQLLRDELSAGDAFAGVRSAGVELRDGAIERMLEEHDAAGAGSVWPRKGRDHSQRLYGLLTLALWDRWWRGLRTSRQG